MLTFKKISLATIASAAAVTIALTSPVYAQTDALRAYKETATASIDTCQLVMNDNIASAKWKIPQPGGLDICLAAKKAAAKAAYEAANKAVKPAARPALKDHLAATFSALNTIAPLTNESESAYEARQRAREAHLLDLWAKVEIAL